MGKVALLVGGTGMAACEIAPTLLEKYEGWTVMVLALDVHKDTFKVRTQKPIIPLNGANLNDVESMVDVIGKTGEKVTHIWWSLDANRPPHLTDAVSIRRGMNVLQKINPVWEAFYTAAPQRMKDYIMGTTAYLAGSGSQPRNILWLGNIFETMKRLDCPLEHFTLGTGGKHYGMHLGPDLWPDYDRYYDEDKTICPGPLSYFEMQGFVEDKAKEMNFTWGCTRPSFIIGKCPELGKFTQSMAMVVQFYACILKAKGKALKFPGSIGNWKSRIQFSSTKKIAEVAVWSALNAKRDVKPTGNQAWNTISTRDFSWEELWPEIAAYFDMQWEGPANDVLDGGLLAGNVMGGDLQEHWTIMMKEHNLQDLVLTQVYNADFLDKTFTATWDSIFSVEKLRRFDFPEDRIYEFDKPMDCLAEFFDDCVEQKVFPPPKDIRVHLYLDKLRTVNEGILAVEEQLRDEERYAADASGSVF